jgi:two-component system C4-dicarboxylate transport sensor histidine kinase DctB
MVQMRLAQGVEFEKRVAERTRDLARELDARREAERELRAAQEGLIHSEKMAALGRMSAAIVHEISQPLAAMEATLAAAEMSLPADGAEKTGVRIGSARNLIRRMQRTIKHLKSFSRKGPAVLERIAVDRVVEAALELVAPRARGAGVEPVVDAVPGVEVRAGAVRLEQVCLNLLLNALDAVEGRAGAEVRVSIASDAGQARIAVQDNGEGIAPDNLPRVAEPFFSTRIGGEGLGLGLSISQAIVEEFGGRIEIASTLGQGTTVTVVLPLADALREAAE